MDSFSEEEKTEQPTEHKLKRNKENELLHYSKDLLSFFILSFFMIFLWFFKIDILTYFKNILIFFIQFNHFYYLKNLLKMKFFIIKFKKIMFFFIFLWIMIFSLSIIVPVLLQNQIINFKKFRINWFFLNFFSIYKNFFSFETLLNFFKIFLITLIVFLIFIFYFFNYFTNFYMLENKNILIILKIGFYRIFFCISVLLFCYMFIVILDVFCKKLIYLRNLKMSRTELKNEFKELEGNSLIKDRRKNNVNIFNNDKYFLEKLNKADLIVLSPKKYIIALQHNYKITNEPIILFIEKEKAIFKLESHAKKMHIPFFIDSDLASSLYKFIKYRSFISESLYFLLLKILRFSYEYKFWKEQGGKRPEIFYDLSIYKKFYFF